ncbi:MAG: CDP-alcohol phosphatidyltransferase family protein, partial [Saprospiraceae bacterium]
FADGLVARALGVSGELGKQLDSLADMVSFGVVPGTIAYVILKQAWYGDGVLMDIPWLAMPGFVFTLFAAYRLGKFNIDTRQSEEFIGLASPGATMFMYGWLMVWSTDQFGLAEIAGNPWLAYIIPLVVGILMVVEIPMFSFKVKNMAWKGNELRYIFIFAAIGLLIGFTYLGILITIALYVLMSLFSRKEKTIS